METIMATALIITSALLSLTIVREGRRRRRDEARRRAADEKLEARMIEGIKDPLERSVVHLIVHSKKNANGGKEDARLN